MSAKDTFLEIRKNAVASGTAIVTTKLEYRKLWKFLDVLLRIVTFNQNKRFLTHFTTTLGNIIAFPEGWKEDDISEHDIVTLKHELKHVEQYRTLGLGSVWLGFFIFGILYLLVPLPIGLAWFRYKFERDAYATSWKTIKEYNLSMAPKIDFYVDCLTGPSYAWAWPFRKRVEKWFRDNT